MVAAVVRVRVPNELSQKPELPKAPEVVVTPRRAFDAVVDPSNPLSVKFVPVITPPILFMQEVKSGTVLIKVTVIIFVAHG